MSKPLVAVVGRPNVGKSTFFNRIVGKRISIVEDTPGITRDRIYADAQWLNHRFTLIDTGGIDPQSEDQLLAQMRRQAQIAIEMADLILFVVDGKEGVTPADQDVANLLRGADKPVMLVVNKVDRFPDIGHYEFFNLGIGEPYPISAREALGLGDMLDEMVKRLPQTLKEEDEGEDLIRIAVVGKPNVGKSSLVNMLLREERAIVSDIPGTTRDAIDTAFEQDGQKYLIIDTAGMRRKAKIQYDSVERYSVVRTLMAVRRADVALIMLDAREEVTEQDTKIAGFVHEEGKASIIVLNKWDLIDKQENTADQVRDRIQSQLSFMNYAPTAFISAKTGQRVNRLLDLVKNVHEQAEKRITTGTLNDVLADAIRINEPPVQSGRRAKIFYGTQVSVKPPTFVLFVNDPQRMHYSYLRYLENQFRKAFGFEGTPLRIQLRARNEKEE